ncbi:MAG: ferric reductase-like transmembrane domain-containing protein, partial [Gammaproteobacteria bacterium]
MSRIFRHIELFLFSAILFALGWIMGTPERALERLSFVSAWLCFAYMSMALFVGPFFRIRYKKSVANIYLRRDVAIWAALVGLLHLVVGTEQSMNDEYLRMFVEEAARQPSPLVREMLFAWGSSIGFIVGVLYLGLLALSSDRAIRVLGIRWWKRLQKSSYLAFGLLVVHGLAFQVLEYRSRVVMLVFIL